MGIEFEAIKQKAEALKNKLLCQSLDHRPLPTEEVLDEKRGLVKITVSCARCGLQLENPYYEWRNK
jgi:hypothetical protein